MHAQVALLLAFICLFFMAYLMYMAGQLGGAAMHFSVNRLFFVKAES